MIADGDRARLSLEEVLNVLSVSFSQSMVKGQRIDILVLRPEFVVGSLSMIFCGIKSPENGTPKRAGVGQSNLQW